ncbi:MAG: 16S rRNA (adenine(1518)-N(6)/adenine(1519)-N(6))-dimethyltransferase RsmA [Ignavibacteria bacterium]|nr:16S rRNA (adenine(1518)-N(6)/adenine(1519)-N(6))-dimethyltransferase RsmA [Ignavibacteria bacterium]
MDIKPIKRLGQNFLIDKNVSRKIVDYFEPKKSDNIIEIGPGLGAITELLYNKTERLICIEIDSRLTEYLKQKFPNAEIYNADFLKFGLSKIFNEQKFRVIGNIPYYITSQILFKLFDENKFIDDALLMIQLEVAKRLTAQPSSKDYGILTIFTNYYSNAEILFKVSRNVFKPKPDVDSAMIRLIFDKKYNLNPDEEKLFKQIIKTGFNQRRKTLRNSLQKLISIDTQCKLNFDFNKRAEEINLDEYVLLTKSLIKLEKPK